MEEKKLLLTSSRAATVCRHCDMRETNVDVVGESTSSRLSSTNSETPINPGMADVCYFHKTSEKFPAEMAERWATKHTRRNRKKKGGK